jgi:ABC-type sugar transport system permease subunit
MVGAFLAPSIALLLAIAGFPLAYNLYNSILHLVLTEPGMERFVGLANYQRLVTSGDFARPFVRTSFFTLVSVALEFVVGLGLALALIMHAGSGVGAWCGPPSSSPGRCPRWSRACSGRTCSTLSAFLIFDVIYVITGGGPGSATETLSYANWRAFLVETNFGYGGAISVALTRSRS